MTSTESVLAWTVFLRCAARRIDAMARLLDDDERRRCATLSNKTDRERFVLSHGAFRQILSDHLGIAPAEVRWRRGRWGKPELCGGTRVPRVSMSHSGDMAVIAIAPRAVGVDVERGLVRWRVKPPAGLFPAAEIAAIAEAPPAERADLFVRLLTRKEACTKVTGDRLIPFGVRLRALGDAESLLVHGPGRSWRTRTIPVPPPYGAAVAMEGEDEFEVVVAEWDLT